MGIIFIISLLLIYFSEKMSNPNLDLNANLGNLEGKEIRFGTDGSSLFSAVTTAFTTGSVNNMHDSKYQCYFAKYDLNVAFGGEGVGLMNMIIYVLLTVFIYALMIGRTPEFLGKKNRKCTNEAYSFGNSYPSLSNNGSGLEGLKDDNLFWNLSTAFAMFCGRYLVLIAQLAIAGSLLAKNTQENTANSLKTDNLTFMFVLVCIIYIFTALTFFSSVYFIKRCRIFIFLCLWWKLD